MKKHIIHIMCFILGALTISAAIEKESSGEEKGLEDKFSQMVSRAEGMSGAERVVEFAKIREQVGAIIGATAMFPQGSSPSDLKLSDELVVDFVYETFTGDLGFLRGSLRSGAKSNEVFTLTQQRVRGLVRAYPLSRQPDLCGEKLSMTIFLAHAYKLIGSNLISVVHRSCGDLSFEDRTPLLVALAEAGDSESIKLLGKMKSTETERLQSVFQRIGKR